MGLYRKRDKSDVLAASLLLSVMIKEDFNIQPPGYDSMEMAEYMIQELITTKKTKVEGKWELIEKNNDEKDEGRRKMVVNREE
ncbi:hypothetical protein KM923_09670 [Cytobacillus oceanisediminis]|nr:hypothetical protein [Cytobacillus oceanisediminis]